MTTSEGMDSPTSDCQRWQGTSVPAINGVAGDGYCTAPISSGSLSGLALVSASSKRASRVRPKRDLTRCEFRRGFPIALPLLSGRTHVRQPGDELHPWLHRCPRGSPQAGALVLRIHKRVNVSAISFRRSPECTEGRKGSDHEP